jgi:hypothetical protein
VAKPVAWTPCEKNITGCERLTVAEAPQTGAHVVLTSINNTPSGRRLSVHMDWTDQGVHEERAIIYDEAGAAQLLWRSGDASCSLVSPDLHDEIIWFGAQPTNAQNEHSAVYIVGDYQHMAKAPTIVATKVTEAASTSSDTFLALTRANGELTIYDGVGHSANTYSGSFKSVHALNDVVLATRMDTGFARGEVLSRTSPKLEPLVQPKGAVVHDLSSDGTTLVWIQTPPKAAPNDESFPAGEIWTSPFTTAAAGLKPVKWGATPMLGDGMSSKQASGYYAFAGGVDDQVHLYRLSDMQTWAIPMPDGGACQGVDALDGEYVFYHTALGSYRQSIASLGAGASP